MSNNVENKQTFDVTRFNKGVLIFFFFEKCTTLYPNVLTLSYTRVT